MAEPEQEARDHHANALLSAHEPPKLPANNKLSSSPQVSSDNAVPHPVTGEPPSETPNLMKRSVIIWRPNPVIDFRAAYERLMGPFQGVTNRQGISQRDTKVIDGVRLATNARPSPEEYRKFQDKISNKLDKNICSINTRGTEDENISDQALKMVLNKEGEAKARVVISCTSKRRKEDIVKGLANFDWHGLPWVVIHDPTMRALSAIELIEGLSLAEAQQCTAYAKLNDRTTNVWDQCLAAPLYIFPETDQSGTGPAAQCHASCTLGGFVEVAERIYGLTVAHPVLNVMAKGSDQKVTTDPSGSCPIGKMRACCLSLNAPEDQASKWVQVPPNSDWALIELGERFCRAELQHSQVADKFSIVETAQLEVVTDDDFEPRKVVIAMGFSKKTEGWLSLARSKLQICASRFSVMQVELSEPLALGDSGSFVILDGRVCGTIIAGRSSLGMAYVLPITDTFSSIDKIFACEAKFPGSGVTSSVQNLAFGEPSVDTTVYQPPQMMAVPPMPDILPQSSRVDPSDLDSGVQDLPHLRTGAWMLNYTPIESQYVSFDGTLRVEAVTGRLRASGDLYQRQTTTTFMGVSPRGSAARTSLLPPPSPDKGIPIQAIARYRYYIRITRARESWTGEKSLELGLQMFSFIPTLNGAGKWSPAATTAVNCTANMTWMPAPAGYPSTADYLEGDLNQGGTSNVLGRLKMGWLSNYLRKATIEIDAVPGSELPLDSGSGHNWQTVGDSLGFDLKIDVSGRDVIGSSAPWSDSAMNDAMLLHRQSSNLDLEWRYHILAVHMIASTPRGIMYDAGATDSNQVSREGLGISSHWRFPDGWGNASGQRFGLAKAPHFRTAVHELGHALGLLHNTADMGFMNTSDVIASAGTLRNPFPTNIKWAFADSDLKRLRHWPDIFIRPGGVPFGDAYNITPSMPSADRTLELEIPGLKLEVAPLLAEVPLGAPVRVELKMSNINQMDHVAIPARIDLKSPALSGVVTDASGTARGFRSIIGCVDEVPLTELEPTASVVKSLTLLRGGEGALFPATGVYEISVTLRWSLPSDQTSPPPDVVVRASTTVFVTGAHTAAHAKAAHRVLTTPDAHLVLALGATRLASGFKAVEAAVVDEDLNPHWVAVMVKALAKSGQYEFGTRLFKRYHENCVASHDEKLKLERLLSLGY